MITTTAGTQSRGRSAASAAVPDAESEVMATRATLLSMRAASHCIRRDGVAIARQVALHCDANEALQVEIR